MLMRGGTAVAAVTIAAVTLAAVSLVRCSGGGEITDAGQEKYGHYHPPDGDTLDGGDADSGDGDAADAGFDACGLTSDWPGFRRLTEFDPCAPADVLVDTVLI